MKKRYYLNPEDIFVICIWLLVFVITLTICLIILSGE
ncbi:MAG: hypothetical protein [Lokiarchaeia virus VerdaV1]|uniref:Uncharacterized protein n=1 Tax=Lokiarchaeia virus VerdaV1 TaxID=3070170 RepID=A0AA35GBN2_9CAUD|nr:MAG: hypothetical protein QIT41_gp40 [Lokiarchaeia virus VerdaV1]BDI54889.1 MAG: hypothetical protein [Lokiarchaeia virus VerdaV1]